jgi:hypothetical protein
VSALTHAGETLACTEVAIANGPTTLDVTHYNTLTWNPIQGAKAYKVYGRTSGAELLMATVDWSTDLHPGGTGPVFPTYRDNGSATPSGALPTKNTTGNMAVEGQLTAVNSGGTATSYQQPVWFGSYALYVDSAGKLRIKSSAPTSDGDGTVVGTQV